MKEAAAVKLKAPGTDEALKSGADVKQKQIYSLN